MRVIPDGSVSETKLRELLDQQAEAANLEFKRLRDLDTTEGVVKPASTLRPCRRLAATS